MPSEQSGKGKVPVSVHEQLTKEFLPAVKGVAVSGKELLGAYQALEQASEAYAKAVEALAQTARNGGEDAKTYGSKLHDLITEYKAGITSHHPCIKEFTVLVSKTVTHSTEEKETLKSMYSKYQKEEKELHKARKKNTKTQSDEDAFYKQQETHFLKQQALRYKFFADKHDHWLQTYKKLLVVENVIESPKENGITDEPKVEDDVPQNPSTNAEIDIVVDEAPVLEETPVASSRKPTQVTEASVAPSVVEAALPNELSHSAPSAKSSRATSLNSIEALPDNTNVSTTGNSTEQQNLKDTSGVFLLNSEKRVSVDVFQTAREVQARSNAPVVVSSKATETVETQTTYNPNPAYVPVPAPREDHPPVEERVAPSNNYQYAQPPPTNNVAARYNGPIIQPVPVIRQREPENRAREQQHYYAAQPQYVDVSPRMAYQPAPQENSYQQPYNYASPRSPPQQQRYQPPPPVQQRVPQRPPVQHQPSPPRVQNSQPRNSVTVPPVFSQSDMGRILRVVTDFNASSGEQLTINKNDRVVLMKNGSRGWIFVQDQASQRTGWIPAPCVTY